MASKKMNLRAPPPFNPDEDSYEKFKKDLQIWDCLTDLPREKKGPAVYLSLTKKAQSAVSELKVAEINGANGMDTILKKLDTVYLADTNTRAYTAFQRFYECKRTSGEKFEDFLVRFEKLYADLTQYDMKLPEGIRAFFVLNACNLKDEMEKLARATVSELTYEAMIHQIKKICGTSVANNDTEDESEAPPLKEDLLFGSYDRRRNHGYGYRGRRGRGGRGGSSRGGYERSQESDWRSRKESGSESDKGGQRKNPVNSYGVRLRCHICDSHDHLARECSRRSDSKPSHEINIVLLNANPENRQKGLLIESLGKGVLDCGCTRTVAGEIWMTQFLDSMLPSDKTDVKIDYESPTVFRFGDGKECKSLRRVVMPVYIGGRRQQLEVEVVDAEIPLLVSKDTMKNIGMQLDFEHDTAVIDGEEIQLACTTSGHYCMPLNVFCVDAGNIVLKVNEIDTLDKKQKLSKAMKLHRQFGHAKASRLLKLISNSHIDDKEFVECVNEVCESCEICKKYQPSSLQPAVGLPLADKFNHVVCLDLKEVKDSLWILHMIDATTKYTAARLVKTKKKNEIISKIFDMWIAYFGRPVKLMSDNGGEFLNDVYTEAAEKLGIEIVMPPADSPFSNGIVERHHKVLYETMMKTIEETKCEPSIALAWACSAKNALLNNNGFSPNQLVFGHNVNLPTVLTDKLPALTPTTSSEIVRKNLEAIHAARTNYQKAENSRKIKSALRHKTRTFIEKEFKNGDEVYYKRRGHRGWKGPARVMGFDRYTILVKHGGSILRCHRSHVTLTKGVTTHDEVDTREKANTELNDALTQSKMNEDTSTRPFFLCSGSESEEEEEEVDYEERRVHFEERHDGETNDVEEHVHVVEQTREEQESSDGDEMPEVEDIPDHLIYRSATGDATEENVDEDYETLMNNLVDDGTITLDQSMECLTGSSTYSVGVDAEESAGSDIE